MMLERKMESSPQRGKCRNLKVAEYHDLSE
jgi:hypothetical protein